MGNTGEEMGETASGKIKNRSPLATSCPTRYRAPMLTKLVRDHVVKRSPTCGEIREILRGGDYSPNLALAIDIQMTTPHFHQTFDEIYLVLDGSLRLKFYDPATNLISEQMLGPNELCVITRGIHHQVTEASAANRLCVITIPHFTADDEHVSERLIA